MSRSVEDIQGSGGSGGSGGSVRPPQLPPDHVLSSGAVFFPGAFDQHGFPLIVFPVDGQAKLSTEVTKAEVVDFITYFLSLHNEQQDKDSLVSVVADLRCASLSTTRFIAETLLLLEVQKRTVHSVYIIQPKKKDVGKLLLKLLASSKMYTVFFRKVLLKEIFELSNYIDRSQLPASLGGYFMYCHQSWVAFIKEIDVFVQDFLSVVQRLPTCISSLQVLSKLPMPSTFRELQHFCSTSEAKFQQLRRELGLDELLSHCERVLDKLRHPEKEACYQAMAGTALFTHTAFNMLQNYNRITATVEKVELMWQQTFSKARVQLQVFQLRDDALQITERIETLLQDKLQPYKMEIAQDAAKAGLLVSEFTASIHTPAMVLVRRAEDVIHTLVDILPLDSRSRERWVVDLDRLKDKLHSTVHYTLQTLRAVNSYHHYYNKADSWYRLVLCENFLQELLSGVEADCNPRQRTNWGTIPPWRKKLSAFLKKNPPPDMEELLHLAHLSSVIPDGHVQQAGKRLSQRCMSVRKLIISSGPVAVAQLQSALQWQYELLRGGAHVSQPPAHRDEAFLDVHRDPNCKSPSELRCSPDASWGGSESDLTNCKPSLDSAPVTGSLLASAQCNPASLTSFDSGFDGAGSSHLEGMEGVSRSGGGRDSVRPALSQTQINEENLVGLWGSEDHTDPSSPSPRVQVVSKVTADSLNLEIKVKRSAAPPNNPWLSLPVDDLENSYTVTITQNPQPQLVDPTVHGTSRCRDQPTQTEVLKDPQTTDCTLSSQSTLEDSELSPIHEVLSSTIRDKSTCTTETTTMIWDSYDLHEQYVDGVSDVSLKDWDVKEQEGLKEVENILDRADQILAEEENVLAQEAMLDVLLKEDRPGHWPPWNAEVQLCEMSSSELTEAGVLGLEDCPVSAEPQTFSEHRSEVDGHRHEEGGCNGRPDLLTELRKVHVLDELIAEENLKIHELRRCSEQETSGSGPSDPNQASSLSEDRHVFRLQLEKEREEVEKLERSLDKEQEEEVEKLERSLDKEQEEEVEKLERSLDKEQEEEVEKLERSLDKEQEEEVEKLERSLDKEQEEKENKDGAGREGTCSTAEQNEEDAALCGERFQAESSGDDVDQLESDTNKSLNLEDPDSAPKLPSLNETGLNSDSDEASAELGIHPLGLDSLGENSAVSSPESSRTLETQLKDGVFDPGGGSAQLRASPPLSSSATEDEAPHSIEVTSADVSSADPIPTQFTDKQPHPPDQDQDHLQVLHPNVKEHSNNNNNNKNLQLESKMTLDSPDISLDDTKGQWTDEGSAGPDAGPHQCPPDCPLEFDPGGGGGVWISEATRTSGSGIQTQFNTNMTQMTSFQTPIVLDTGSGLMKAGFADQDLPSVIFPTIIGLPKYEEIMNSSAEREVYIGHEAQHMRGVLALKHPIRNGIIRNWDDMEKIWHHTFQQLCVDPEDHPVLVTEAAMNPLENRQRTVEIMFECFGVPFTYVAMQAVLALYAAGRTTGVVFDSGDGVSHSVPVFDGYCLPHAVQRFPLAGADVTAQLKKLLQEQGVSMRTTAELEIVREMKEKCCYLALNYEQELSGGGPSGGVTHYTMPDGQVVSLGTERFRAPEILFKPQLIGRDHYGMHESIFKSILGSDMDLRRCFLGNIILSGGNTLLGGLPERLQAELRGLVTSDLWDGVRVSSPSDRDFSVWSGGAVLANGAGPGLAWISQDEYEEHGPQIVFRKCF